MNATTRTAPTPTPTPTVGQLVGTLVNETGTLVKQELRLASTEMTRKAETAAKDMSLVGAGAAVALAGLVLALLAALAGSPVDTPVGFGARIRGALGLVAGAVLVWMGIRKLRAIDPVPRKALRSVHAGGRIGKEAAT